MRTVKEIKENQEKRKSEIKPMHLRNLKLMEYIFVIAGAYLSFFALSMYSNKMHDQPIFINLVSFD